MRRLLQFRTELVTLWRAFFAPETPLHLKALMLLVPAYLLSPIDLIPDIVPIAGLLDDVVIIPLLVSWIVSMLPRPVPVQPRRGNNGSDRPVQVIDADYRRL